ncbi:Transposase [Oopsacas minuta]|uniref:Transposase n=1 Tax=Oopsacas minuta TaxID=111878 RepID=A0AAV7KKS1_9METZ|nr:Transposase [Oopsacas minuta]
MVCSKLVPHLSTLEQKNRRIQFCRSKLLKYSKADSRRHSEVITGDETWVYFFDMLPKQQSSKWIFEDDVPDTIPKRFMAVSKRIFAIFFTTRGILEFVMLPAKHTVTAAWTECCLPKVSQAVETLRPKSGICGIKFHHGNAPAHTTRRTKEFLRQSGLEMIEHPPYCSDLAPCDFWLFLNLKRN